MVTGRVPGLRLPAGHSAAAHRVTYALGATPVGGCIRAAVFGNTCWRDRQTKQKKKIINDYFQRAFRLPRTKNKRVKRSFFPYNNLFLKFLFLLFFFLFTGDYAAQ